jgi:hypothetical protein
MVSNEFLGQLCNELAQPVTTLTLGIHLIEEGTAQPEDLVMLRNEVARLALVVQHLRTLAGQEQLVKLSESNPRLLAFSGV